MNHMQLTNKHRLDVPLLTAHTKFQVPFQPQTLPHSRYHPSIPHTQTRIRAAAAEPALPEVGRAGQIDPPAAAAAKGRGSHSSCVSVPSGQRSSAIFSYFYFPIPSLPFGDPKRPPLASSSIPPIKPSVSRVSSALPASVLSPAYLVSSEGSSKPAREGSPWRSPA